MVEWSISLQPQEELAAFARFGNAVASLCVEKKGARACLKNHFRNLQAPLCGIFYPHSVAVARYAALIRIKSPTNWDSQFTKSLFQTRSNSVVFGCQFLFLRSHRYDPDKQPADLYPLPLTVTSQSSQSPAFCPVPLPLFSSPSLSD